MKRASPPASQQASQPASQPPALTATATAYASPPPRAHAPLPPPSTPAHPPPITHPRPLSPRYYKEGQHGDNEDTCFAPFFGTPPNQVEEVEEEYDEDDITYQGDWDGWTALHRAARGNHAMVLKEVGGAGGGGGGGRQTVSTLPLPGLHHSESRPRMHLGLAARPPPPPTLLHSHSPPTHYTRPRLAPP